MYREGDVIDQLCQKWFVKFCVGDFLLDVAPQSGRPVEVDSDKLKHWEQSTLYHTKDSWHTKNIQINKVIGGNENSVIYFVEKSKQTFCPTQ